MSLSLKDQRVGAKLKITDILPEGGARKKLLSIGVMEGDVLEITRKAITGSPLAIKHGKSHFFALRKDLAANIMVEQVS